MAKRMKFSVIGLPHYTIWHLYEPSVEDIKHMEQVEAEKRKKAEADKRTAEIAAKIKEEFGNPDAQYQADRAAVQDLDEAEQAKKQQEYEEVKEKKEKMVLKGEGADESVYGEGGVARVNEPPPLRRPPQPAGAIGANGEAPAKKMDE